MDATVTSPDGKQFMTVIKNYLDKRGINSKISPLFTDRRMGYDTGLYESLNVFLTLVAVVEPSKRKAVVEFLNGDAMLNLHNEEYRLESENPSRERALNFLKEITK